MFGSMRTAIYVVAGLGALAWAFPIAVIVEILSGYEKGLVGAFLREFLISDPPYGRISLMVLGALCSLLAPIWLRRRGQDQWALGSAIISLAIVLVFFYGPAIIASVQSSH